MLAGLARWPCRSTRAPRTLALSRRAECGPVGCLARRSFTAFHSNQWRNSPHRLGSLETKQEDNMSLRKTFTIQLAGGKTAECPSLGFGTWAFEEGKTPVDPAHPSWLKDALKVGFDVGYRHLEGAWFYGVDNEIRETIKEYGIPREQLFINSKIWNSFFHPDLVEVCCDKILKGLGTDYLDCLLLHWPVAFEPISHEACINADPSNQASMEKKGMLIKDGNIVVDWKHTSEPIAKAGGHPEGSIVPTWNAMKELVKKGKTKAIGVSNFDIADLKAILPYAQDVPISMNQVEVNPWYPNTELINFCNEHKIVVSCFSPFAGQKADGRTLIHDPTVQQLAKKNNMGVGQLLQSWGVQRGTVPVGKSGNPGRSRSKFVRQPVLTIDAERIKANFSIRKLSDEDMKAIDDLEIPNGQGRSIDFTDAWGVKLWQKE